VAAGPTPKDELLARLEDGIVIKQLLGFGQSNLINGDFSCNVGLGFRVRDGEIVGRVKDTMVAGNFYELFARPLQFSSEVDPVLRMPHAVVEALRVSAASEA
jgi:PmbA protein